MKTIKELELSLIVKEAMIQQLKFKNNQLEERITKVIDYIEHLRKEWVECSAYDNINLYMFETYLDGISKLVELKDILEDK